MSGADLSNRAARGTRSPAEPASDSTGPTGLPVCWDRPLERDRPSATGRRPNGLDSRRAPGLNRTEGSFRPPGLRHNSAFFEDVDGMRLRLVGAAGTPVGLAYAIMFATIIGSGLGVAKGEGRVASRSAPTYVKDVAPILQKRCQSCHRKGQVGPFAG